MRVLLLSRPCQGRFRHKVENPVHDFFCVLGRDLLQSPAAAHGNQEEQAPAHYRESLQQFINCWQVIRGLLRHQGIDLNRKPQAPRFARHFQRAVETSRDGTYCVVPRGVGSIEAQAQTLDAVRLQQVKGIRGKGWSGTRSYRNLQTERAGSGDYSEQVFATERVTPGKDQVGQRVSEFG